MIEDARHMFALLVSGDMLDSTSSAYLINILFATHNFYFLKNPRALFIFFKGNYKINMISIFFRQALEKMKLKMASFQVIFFLHLSKFLN